MTETERQNQLRWFSDLKEFIEAGDTEIASQMVNGAILLLERQSTQPGTRTARDEQGNIRPFSNRIKI